MNQFEIVMAAVHDVLVNQCGVIPNPSMTMSELGFTDYQHMQGFLTAVQAKMQNPPPAWESSGYDFQPTAAFIDDAMALNTPTLCSAINSQTVPMSQTMSIKAKSPRRPRDPKPAGSQTRRKKARSKLGS